MWRRGPLPIGKHEKRSETLKAFDVPDLQLVIIPGECCPTRCLGMLFGEAVRGGGGDAG